MKKTYSPIGDEEMIFKVNRKEVKIRKNFGTVNPVTKVLPKKRKRREKDNLRKKIYEELDEFHSNQ